MKLNILLDSGAFSVSKGGIVDIHKYIEFLHKWKDHIEGYFVFDKIYDGETTWKNQKMMEDAGLFPIPVYHQGTDIKYLHKCMEYPFFGMGGVGGKGYSFLDIVKSHDECWSIICDDNGYPRSKVHGFGITSPKVMLRYPFWSVDSTSWVINSRYGWVIIPRYKNGKPNYTIEPQFIAVCGVKRSSNMSRRYLFDYSKSEREVVVDYIESKGFKLGKSEYRNVPLDYKLQKGEQWAESRKIARGERRVELVIEPGVVNNIYSRDRLNATYYKDLSNTLEYPRQFKIRNKRIYL